MVKKLSLTVIFAAILTLGLTANGLAGGGLEGPDPATERLAGPKIDVFIALDSLIGTATLFKGKCKGKPIQPISLPPTEGVFDPGDLPESPEDLVDGRIIGATQLFPQCFAVPGKELVNGDLVITKVKKFFKTVDTITGLATVVVAQVTFRAVVPL